MSTMILEARGGLETDHQENTSGVLRRPGPQIIHRTNIFGNGVETREFAGVSEEWYFDTTTRTYESVADRTNGSK